MMEVKTRMTASSLPTIQAHVASHHDIAIADRAHDAATNASVILMRFTSVVTVVWPKVSMASEKTEASANSEAMGYLSATPVLE